MKILGLSFVSFAIFLLGYIKSCSLKRNSEIEDGFVLLISHIRAFLSSSAMPLDRIYESFSDEALSSSGFLEELNKKDCDSFYNAMCKKGNTLLKNQRLSELVTDFSKKIGTSPSSGDGRRLCENCLQLMKEEIDRTREKDKTKAELYSKLSIVFAVFVFLMFI